MTTPDTPFTRIYAQWLESFRALIPGATKAGPSETRKQEQVAANQEWEDEGGALKPEGVPQAKPSVPASS